jgi:hypothetical protein
MATTRIDPRASRIPVDAIATSNLTLSGAQTVDTVALTPGKLCAALGQGDNKNAVYLVQSGAWVAVDTGIGTGLEVYATGGSANVNAVYGCDTTGAITWGTTTTTFTKKSGSGTAVVASSVTTPSIVASGTNGLGISTTPADSLGNTGVAIGGATLTTGGTALLQMVTVGTAASGALEFGCPSLGQADALCEAEILIASGTVTAGQVVVWSGTKKVAAAGASAGLTTIAGVALTAGSNGVAMWVAKRGRCYVNSDAGVAAGTVLKTSGAVAGNVVDGAAIAGGIVGRACEAVSATVSGKVLVDLVLG